MKPSNSILGTIEISHKIETLIKESVNNLIIVSPYLKITERIKSLLTIYLPKINDCYFVFRESELKYSEKNWLKSFKNIHLVEVKNLHAKIYLNDTCSIVTSMNFYEYSQINNYEIGIVFDRKSDEKSYYEIVEQVRLITALSENNKSLQSALDFCSDYTVGKLHTELSRFKAFRDYPSFL